jgi:hypothetical protein
LRLDEKPNICSHWRRPSCVGVGDWIASIIYAQSNMTGGNMTGGNMTGGNMSIPSATLGGDGGGDGDDGGDGGSDEGGSN